MSVTKLEELDTTKENDVSELTLKPSAGYRKYEIIYINVMGFIYIHIAAMYGLYLCFNSVRWQTILLCFAFYTMSALGVTAGVHRLWSHRTYKAKLPLQIILMLFNTMACQRTILKWARDHRLHHKYSDTDADPHNASRGIFYSHVGWLMVRKHPDVIEKGKQINISDLTRNPIVMFQDKYYYFLFTSLGFLMPALIPIIFWDESFINSWHVNLLRYVLGLQVAFLVNSVAHRFGYRPYDGRIMPSQSIFISLVTLGEAFHNYHHVFPWDYRTAELGNDTINFTTIFIDFFASIGWAYDLKTASEPMIKSRIQRTGDGSNLWGKYDS